MSEETLRIPLDVPWLFGEVAMLREDVEALSIRLNALEKAHNRLAHYVGHATEANTIDRDMGAKV